MTPERVRQLRELRGLTQLELAKEVGITQQAIHQIETGLYLPSLETADAIANALHVTSEVLNVYPTALPEGSLGLTRARRSRPALKDLLVARQRAAIACECLTRMTSELEQRPVKLPKLTDGTPELAAELTRSALGLSPDAPIRNLTLAVERAGVAVIGLQLTSSGPGGLDDEDELSSATHVDGFSAWIDDGAWIFLDRRLMAFRWRATLAHEIGHLVLMHQAPRGQVASLENEAWRFASALLCPANVLKDDLFMTEATLDTLSRLRAKWGVSIAFILESAYRSGILPRSRRDYLWKVYRKHFKGGIEPGDLSVPRERPRTSTTMAEVVYGKEYDVATVAASSNSPLDVVQDLLRGTLPADPLEAILTRP